MLSVYWAVDICQAVITSGANMQDYTQALRQYQNAQNLGNAAISRQYQQASPWTALAQALSGYVAGQGMKGAEGRMQSAKMAEEQKLADQNQALMSAWTGYTPRENAQAGGQMKPQNDRQGLMAAMMGSTDTGLRNLALGQAIAQPKARVNPDYTIGNNRYSGETNELLVSGPTQTKPEDAFKYPKQLRDEFTKASKDFVDMRDAFNKIESASDTGAGDVSLIFGFMKLIDPGSTVREGEFATAEQTAGIPDRIVNLYNKALSGDRLGAPQRESFKSEAANLFNSQRQSQLQLENVYKGLSDRFGIDSENVVIDLMGDLRGREFTPPNSMNAASETIVENPNQEQYKALPIGAPYIWEGETFYKGQ